MKRLLILLILLGIISIRYDVYAVDLRISELPPASTQTGAEMVPEVQSGITKRTTVGAIVNTPGSTAYEPKNSNIQAHILSSSNPHNTAASQVGAPALVIPSVSGNFVCFNGTQGLQGDCGVAPIYYAPVDSPTFTTYVKIPYSSNPTVDSVGKIAINTSSGANSNVTFYGDTAYKLSGYISKSFIIDSPTSNNDYPLWKVPHGITIKAVHCVVEGTSTPSATGMLDECTGTGGICSYSSTPTVTAVASDVTCDVSNTSVTSFTHATVTSGNYLGWHTTSVSGTVNSLTITYEYVIN